MIYPIYPKICNLTSNINISYTNSIDVHNKKILVLSLVNNCKDTVPYIEKFITDISNSFSVANFAFFTNNNIDSTENILDSLAINYKPNISILKHHKEVITKINRIYKFSTYRNLNFVHALKTFGSDFDYLLVFDSDLVKSIPIEPIIQGLKINNKWSCISGNCCYDKSSYYYDELALRLLDDSISIAEKHPKFYDFYGFSERWISQLYTVTDWLKVKAAFGGVSIYRMPEILSIYHKYGYIYNINQLPPFTAEHVSLNLLLKDDILINPNIIYNNSVNLEGKMYYKPVCFVPRDAGFFSVFNFYIGGLTQGLRMYPLWNKESLLKAHRTNNHFAYWTDSFNCWFDYFEPVSFYSEDQMHHSDEYLKLPIYSGENGPDEFRLPHKTKELLTTNSEYFQTWRNQTHEFFKRHIILNKDIAKDIELFWTKHFSDVPNIIGVHYRHPSHFIESGKVYLENYFDKIDNILKQYPTSKIFLASDSQFGIYAFMEKYSNKIVYLPNVDRISMSEFLHWSFSLAEGKPDEVGFVNGKGYELHHKRIQKQDNDNKKMTTDLLKEVFLLSKCNQLVNSISNIPLAISYINPKIEIFTL